MSGKILLYSTRDAADYEAALRASDPTLPLVVCRGREEAAAAIGEAEIVFAYDLPPELYPRARRLRWIQTMTAGVEPFVAAPLPEDVMLTRVAGVFDAFISEYVLGYMLAHCLGVAPALEAQRAHRWKGYVTRRLAGKRLGVAGLGSLGRAVVEKARAFGMEVWGLNRSGRAEGVPVARVFGPAQLLDFVAGLDYLAIALPRTRETEGLFDSAAFRALPRGAFVVNVGRGHVVDEAALIEALRSGHLGGAALDVFHTEPLPSESPLWDLPNVLVTPHSAGASVPEEVSAYFLDNLARYRRGEPLVGVVDRARGY